MSSPIQGEGVTTQLRGGSGRWRSFPTPRLALRKQAASPQALPRGVVKLRQRPPSDPRNCVVTPLLLPRLDLQLLHLARLERHLFLVEDRQAVGPSDGD